ncbi:MAG: hypothetical protein JOZ46_03540 [Candidatus Dormibacteraeota bacterium]|nr:hypothetical protein [Candidatus Dormibacteraeota bacterium]MBV9524875.1 hypothetical protein [Candidatus Dormibacteraeota bacterium]
MSPTALERTSQNIPVPIGGLAPARGAPPVWRAALRRNRGRWLSVAGLALAATGAALALSTPATQIYMSAGTVWVGSDAFTAVRQSSAVRVFRGPLTLVLVSRGAGVVRGTAVGVVDGTRMSGVCDLDQPAATPSERCTFTLGGSANTVTATDSFDAATRTWHRRYSDGRTVTFAVPPGGQLVPIPVPLGLG